MKKEIEKFLKERTELNGVLHNDKKFKESILKASLLIYSAIKKGKKILIFGNGGSAAQAQHFAAELICKFEKQRKAIPAIALTTDTSILTAQSNDVSFDSIFSRQIEALCQKGDIVIGLTTSDAKKGRHSKNILLGLLEAKKKQAKIIGLFSEKTENLLSLADVAIIIPAKNTSLIQEAHLTVIHLLCKLLEY